MVYILWQRVERWQSQLTITHVIEHDALVWAMQIRVRISSRVFNLIRHWSTLLFLIAAPLLLLPSESIHLFLLLKNFLLNLDLHLFDWVNIGLHLLQLFILGIIQQWLSSVINLPPILLKACLFRFILNLWVRWLSLRSLWEKRVSDKFGEISPRINFIKLFVDLISDEIHVDVGALLLFIILFKLFQWERFLPFALIS